jgi:hypothetical protein
MAAERGAAKLIRDFRNELRTAAFVNSSKLMHALTLTAVHKLQPFDYRASLSFLTLHEMVCAAHFEHPLGVSLTYHFLPLHCKASLTWRKEMHLVRPQ